MMKRILIVVALLLFPVSATAWNDRGHMTVAYIAYQQLSQPLRDRVDTLLKRNPQYSSWIAGVPAADRKLAAFLKAATWPDCIKQELRCPGYKEDGSNGGEVAPPEPEASRNIGYTDKDMHKYWHFINQPFSSSGIPTVPPQKANVVREISILTAAIESAESESIKSYDLVWLEHLVGDIHQPLHAMERFTKSHPNGDAGGNLVKFCSKPCTDNLHSYWDGIFGTETKLSSIKALGNELLMKGKPQGANITNIQTWATESFELGKTLVYVSPISSDVNGQLSPRPNAQYEAKAQKTAERQVLLAGYRLAALLTAHLK